ncbi:MAG: trypsin-like peptidase domain-containing protein [Bacteroidota bacterium]
MMKQLFSFVFAGIIGGLIVLGGLQLFQFQTIATEIAPITQLTNISDITPKIEKEFPFDFKEAAKIATPAVVHIAGRQTTTAKGRQRPNNDSRDPFDFFFSNPFEDQFGPKQGTGSGVIYSSDGYIITNNHVIDFADEITVTLNDNRQFKATVVGTYPEADLAVLEIEAEGLPTLELSNSDVAEIGEWVLAVGNPFNLNSTVTAGIISAKGRSIDAIRSRQANGIESFIQTDAAVNPGNSGGALVDSEGKLLGINTAIATRTGSFAGYSFAIPINLVKRIVDDLIENGEFERVMLGVSVFEVDSDYADEFDLTFTQGLVVKELVDGGAAQYSGVQENDIIVAVNDREVTTFPELQEVISTMRNGDVVQLRVFRDGLYRDIEVRLKAG